MLQPNTKRLQSPENVPHRAAPVESRRGAKQGAFEPHVVIGALPHLAVSSSQSVCLLLGEYGHGGIRPHGTRESSLATRLDRELKQKSIAVAVGRGARVHAIRSFVVSRARAKRAPAPIPSVFFSLKDLPEICTT